MKKTKLFCLPYAGGSASIYYSFKNRLKDTIKLYPIELAGKGSRFADAYSHSFNDLVEDTLKYITSIEELDEFAIFGYSMGSLVAYEVSLKLCWKLERRPKMVFFAACSPPNIPSKGRILSSLDDSSFINEIKKLGGMAPEIVNNEEMLRFFLPAIRKDFELVNMYESNKAKIPLPVNTVILYSDQDNEDDNIHDWGKFTSKECEYFRFNDGHFFINKHYNEIVDIINDKL